MMHLIPIYIALACIFTHVWASPHVDLHARSPKFLNTRDLSGSSSVPFVYGATNTALGQVTVSISDGILTITYPTLPSGGTYTDLHAIVQTSPITEANQGKWPYTLGKGFCSTSGTCSIPVDPSWRNCDATLYIGVHASFSLSGMGNTGWADGTCISTRPNCPKYFMFKTKCECPVVTTYAPYTTSLVYQVTRTIVETSTTTCSTQPGPVTVTATCTNPNAGAIETMDGGAGPGAGFVCTAPAA